MLLLTDLANQAANSEAIITFDLTSTQLAGFGPNRDGRECANSRKADFYIQSTREAFFLHASLGGGTSFPCFYAALQSFGAGGWWGPVPSGL